MTQPIITQWSLPGAYRPVQRLYLYTGLYGETGGRHSIAKTVLHNKSACSMRPSYKGAR